MKHLRLLVALLALFTGGSNLFAQGWTPQPPADGDFYLYNVGTGNYLSCGSEYWGTKACIDNGALNFTLASNGEGAYTLYTTSTFSYGNPNAAQLQSSGYVDQSIRATTWTFTAVDGLENTYTMLNAEGTYLVAPSDGTKSILLNAEAPTTNYGYWKLINKDNLFPETASESNPVDITCLIGDASFESTNDKMENFWTIIANNNNLKLGDNGGLKPNNVVESWQSSNGFTLSQTITVPNGYYKLTAQTWCREYTATGADLPYIYLNDVRKDFNLMGTETASLSDVAGFFSNGDNGNYYTTETDVAMVSAKSITLGAKGTRTNTWNVFDNFKLYYLGPIDLTEFANQLAAAVAAAEATEGTIPTAAYQAIAAVVEDYNKTYEDEDGYSTAINAINNAVATYASQEIVDAYNYYKIIRAAVLAINSDIDTADADAKAEAVTTADQTEAVVAVRAALMNYLKNSGAKDVNLTDALLTNPGFELGNVSGWTNSGTQSAGAQGNKAFDNTQGNYYAERWHAAGTVDLNQTVSSLAAGVYEIGAYLYTDTNDGKLYANDVKTSFSTSGLYTVSVAVDNDASIKFGASCTLTGSTWICMDGFTLTYKGGLPDVTAVEGIMNKDVAAAQTAAINAYNTEKTVANYNAAIAAINAAQASVEAYAKAATAVAKAKAIKENHNLASAEAATTFAEAIANIENLYNESTLVDADASSAGITLGTAVSEWHANPNGAAVAYLNNGFALTTEYQADPALHVNTWSTEGDTDGSGFSVPFYESWTSNTNSLSTNTWTGSLTGLDNGLYKVSAWVRVRAKNETAVADATGITMDVNGGTAVDVTEGTQVGESQFQLATYEAEGLVKDGNLTVNFNIAADNNISWLSFQNVKYEKVRDLTPEEQAVVPTGITLDGTATIFKGKTLQLTPAFAPEDATQTVTWASDNEAVATVSAEGVVTAVAYGTANITVTSTLNAEATATCAVTVTAPLITEAENLDFAEGPVRSNHIRTYAKDITGTDLSGLQEVTGWTIVANGDARAAGVMAYGSSYGMGSNSNNFYAPANNPTGEVSGNALGMVGVWTGSVQYIQNVKIPAGAYTITVPIYRNGGGKALTKNLIGVILDNETEYLATTTTYSANQWTTETIKFSITEDTYGKLSLGLNAPDNGSNDCQRLWIDGINITFEPFATADEIAALNSAIEAAEAKSLGFDEGEFAPYKNIDALKALASAKTLNVENPIAQSEVLAAINALTNATWTANEEEVNAFFDGSFASEYSHDGNVMPIGWHGIGNYDNATNVRLMWDVNGNAGLNATSSKQGAFAKFTAVYGTEAGYTMPLKAGTYSLKFIYGGWNEVGERIIKVYNDDNEATFLTETNIKAKDNKAHTTVDSWSAYNGFFTIPADGNYIFSFYRENTTSQNQLVFSDIEIKKANVVELNDVSSEDLPNAAENAVVKLTRKFVNKWNPICLPFEVTDFSVFGDDCEVVKYTGDEMSGDDHVTLKFETVTEKMEANVPYMVWVKEDADVTSSWNLTFTGVDYNPAETPVSAGTNYDYVGVYKNYAKGTSPIANGDVILSSGTYKTVTGNGGNAIKGFRGYWKKNPNAAGAKSVSAVIDGQETDDIKSIELIEAFTEGIYNLQGQKVNHARKGVYIVNGKKVVIK